jgi:uncharacterized protein YrzB (UPF0473 family)
MANVENLEEQLITLEGEDGRSYVCRILGLFEFDEKQYALLLNLGEPGKEGEEEPSTVVMKFFARGGQAVFRIIEDDEEFDKVINFVRELAQEMDSEPEA